MLITAILVSQRAHKNTILWERFGVPNIAYRNSDAFTITGSVESRRAGFDPRVNNPKDPWGRLDNYPRTWELLVYTGLGTAQTEIVAAIFWVTFLVATFALMMAGPTWG